jgi:para-nitrobenzyl esterase
VSFLLRVPGRTWRKSGRVVVAAALPFLGLGAGTPPLREPAALQDPIRVDGGLVKGVQAPDSPVRSYKGIPFAAPPVGGLRWKPPQGVVPWEGVKQADRFSDACVQDLQRSRLPWTQEFMHQGGASEDCLYLNVWTAARSPEEKRPVLLFIHGGGLREGSSAIVTYDGEALARKGVVAVGIHYRLGPIGFLAHPELTRESEHGSSGNYGFLDQIAALKWVQANIAAFGGDPAKVTIHGQSAGARSVAALMASPLARGLFARAIIQSGAPRQQPGPPGGPSLADAEKVGLAAQKALGVGSLAELRALPAERFLAPDLGRMNGIQDGWVLPSADRQNDVQVPVITGCTANDMFTTDEDARLTVETYEAEAKKLYGEHAGTLLELYPVGRSGALSAKLDAARDKARVSVFLWAERQQKKSGSLYTYYFDRAIPWPEHPEFGAFHTGEIPYVFDNLDKLDRPWQPVDRTVADQMSSYWVHFAATGNPNGEGLARWPAFDASTNVTMRLGEHMGPMPTAAPAKVGFWRTFFEKSTE